MEKPNNDFSNPNAPEDTKAPQFTVPFTKKRLPLNSTGIMMTPRSVMTGQKDYSSIVMTPKAGITDSTKGNVPILKGGQAKVKTVKGSKESAHEKSIFKGEEGFLDRAMERRKTERQETMRLQNGKGEGEDWHTIPSPPLPIQVEQEITQFQGSFKSIEQRSELDTVESKERYAYKSKMVEEMCKIMEWDNSSEKSKSSSVTMKTDRFLPGRMSYSYDLLSNITSTPNTLIHGRDQQILVPAVDLKLYSDLMDLFQNKQGKKSISNTKIEIKDTGDIFPDAGVDYIFSDDLIQKPPKKHLSLFDNGVDPLKEKSMIPESITLVTKNLSQTHKIPIDDEKDDYNFDGYEMDSDDDDDGGRAPKLSKKQIAEQEKRKFDKQLKKVTTIMDKKYKSDNKEET